LSTDVTDKTDVNENALKGQSIIAQGKAQRRPGLQNAKDHIALKGQCKMMFRIALSGRFLLTSTFPRALPWADMQCPFGPKTVKTRIMTM